MDDLVHLDTSCLKNQKKILDKICLKILLHTYSNMQKRCFCTWNQCLQYIEPVPLHAEPMVLQVEPLPLQVVPSYARLSTYWSARANGSACRGNE